jgi:hypothetical protein
MDQFAGMRHEIRVFREERNLHFFDQVALFTMFCDQTFDIDRAIAFVLAQCSFEGRKDDRFLLGLVTAISIRMEEKQNGVHRMNVDKIAVANSISSEPEDIQRTSNLFMLLI